MSNEWISLYEKIPQSYFMVIGSCDDDVFQCYHISDGLFIEMDMETHIDVNHWQYLPSPPDTGEK